MHGARRIGMMPAGPEHEGLLAVLRDRPHIEQGIREIVVRSIKTALSYIWRRLMFRTR
jgi:hypothetical protein